MSSLVGVPRSGRGWRDTDDPVGVPVPFLDSPFLRSKFLTCLNSSSEESWPRKEGVTGESGRW